jgi:cap1 methyltransferase
MKYLLKVDEEDKPFEIENLQWELKQKNNVLIYRKYYEDICHEKEKIDKLEDDQEWDRIKKIGNPFELIYTSFHKKKRQESISNYQPISRSYFKMWEIYYNFSDKIFQDIKQTDILTFGHLAEGPGGFMEATYNYRNQLLKGRPNKDIYYGITLRPNNEYVPDWTKMRKIFSDSNQIKIEYGNLYILPEVKNFIKNFYKNKAYVVTADGGFDYSSDFNGQEINSCQIIYSECVVAMNILKKNGTFVCKVFDLFTSPMIKILYFMTLHFDEVYLYKPETSRPANSEKYLVCIRYRDILKEEDKNYLLYLIQVYQDYQTKNKIKENETLDLLNIRVPNSFVHSLMKYNHMYIEQQKFYLQKTINLSYTKPTKDEYDKLMKEQVKNATQWCKKYNVPINYQSIHFHS